MRLSRIRVDRENFSHPLWQLQYPDSIPEKDKPELISKIRQGNLEAGHLVINTHIRLALTLVGRYLTFIDNKSISDLLVSASLEGLCYGVNAIRERGIQHDNLTGYLTECMHRFISDELERRPVVRIPGRTKRDHRQKGKDVTSPVTRVLTDKIINAKFDRKVNTSSELEIREILEKIIQSPIERYIIERRIVGEPDVIIAEALSLSNTSVYMIRRELQNRFVSFFGD